MSISGMFSLPPSSASRSISIGPITLTSAVSFPSSLANTFVQVGIGLALTGPVTVTIGNNLGLSFDGTVTGAGGLVKAGAGTLQIFGANTYQGATSIQAGGVFLFDTATGLGSAGAGTSVATNALLYVSGMVTVAEPLTLAAGATLGCGSGSPVWSGPVTLSGPGQSGINTNTGATLTVSGLISGAGGLGHGGGGPLVLTNDNTYADATVTGYGNALLVVNGSQPQSDITVANGGSLGGSGVVGVVATNGGGTITPGFGPGILSTKNLFLILIDTVRIDLNGTSPGTGYDRISASGNVFLGGSTLQVVLGFTPAPGSVFTIVQATGTVNETFAGLAQDATFQVSGKSFQIHYGANAVTLTAVCAMADSTAPTVSAPPAATVTQSRCN